MSVAAAKYAWKLLQAQFAAKAGISVDQIGRPAASQVYVALPAASQYHSPQPAAGQAFTPAPGASQYF